MSARVGAMGIYYDWLFDHLSPAERAEIRTAILQTVKFDDAAGVNHPGIDDLRYAICGRHEFSGMQCLSDWTVEGGPRDIARQYLAGHAPGAQFNTVLGLIAIRDEEHSVDDLIDTIYQHFKDGVITARAAVTEAPCTEDKIKKQLCPAEQLRKNPWLAAGESGGFQTLFGYNASSVGELPERLRVWQRAFQLDEHYAQTTAPWLKFAVLPYIYGLRGDHNFPARGDNFTIKMGDFDIAPMALAAAQGSDEMGGLAQHFYREEVISKRSLNNSRTLSEQLLFGVPPTRETVSPAEANLKLSALYPVSGNVLIRNSWAYADSPLLDFKSTSFISINHHHLDQNSFSVFYKAPLLIDSGQYDKYGSAHWRNYYERTIAHNSIVLFQENDVYNFQDREVWANDGGQWFNKRSDYPTQAEISGVNKLDGITAYHEGGWYSYTEGDATKAYLTDKLSPKAGFVRSIVYLREDPADSEAKATVIVFDRVRAASALAATSLLHTVKRPEPAPSGLTELPGRYKYDFKSDASTFTVRNGDGMATIQALLPIGGKVELVGGNGGEGKCKQVKLDDQGRELIGEETGDCRYVVYGNVGGVKGWYNYAPVDDKYVTGDNGNWRLEISPATAPAAGAAQYFLNVIRVADAVGTGTVELSGAQKAVLLKATSETGYETVGVQIGTNRRIIFNGAAQRDMWPVWKPGDFKGTTLIVGLVPNTCYGSTTDNGMKTLKPTTGLCEFATNAGGVIEIVSP